MDFDTAERWFQHACELRRVRGEEQGLINDLAWLGRLRALQGQVGLALDYTAQAVERMDALRDTLRVWEGHDVYICRAEALAASGDAAGAKRFLGQAYNTLMLLADQIGEPQVRQRFLDYFLTVRIVTAHASGVITAYPNSRVNLKGL